MNEANKEIRVNFTTINHVVRLELGLTANEYMVADLIYNLANNPESSYPGWCYASKKRIGEYLGLTEQSIHTIIKHLIGIEINGSPILEKHPETKHLRMSSTWYNLAVIKRAKESLTPLKKVELDTKESLVRDTKESLVNKDIYNKDINNINNTDVLLIEKSPLETALPVKFEYGSSDINEVSRYFLERLDLPKEDCTQKQSRQYWSLLLKESRTGVEGVKWLINLAAEDQFLASNITSSKDLYYKRVKLVARKRGNAPKVAIQQ